MFVNAENQQIYSEEEIQRMHENEQRIIVNGNGLEKTIEPPISFPDKKRTRLVPQEFEEAVKRVAELKEGASVGQTEAIWQPKMEYPDKPMSFLFLTDPHYLSTRISYELLNHYITTVNETPNFFLGTGGDDIDAFNVMLGKNATGTYEDPFEVGFQARAWAIKMKELDSREKIGFMVFGNHTDWTFHGGIDFYDTYLGSFECPILTTGGMVHLKVGEQLYEVATTHKYWGNSKLNPTNRNKRYLEHEYPQANIVLLGDTHQSEGLSFERAGVDRIAVVGGTLKLYEEYARKHGIGGRAGTPGHCITVWPDHFEMMHYKNFDRAVADHLLRLK